MACPLGEVKGGGDQARFITGPFDCSFSENAGKLGETDELSAQLAANPVASTQGIVASPA
jgi:hypothetical protein